MLYHSPNPRDHPPAHSVVNSLIKTTVETLRTRLDRIYLEALVAAERSGESRSATEEEVKVLEDELESLYAEILPVAQMSAEQQHLEPILKSIDMQGGQSIRRSAVAVSYVCLSMEVSCCSC